LPVAQTYADKRAAVSARLLQDVQRLRTEAEVEAADVRRDAGIRTGYAHNRPFVGMSEVAWLDG
jgi:hypothetical protein